MGLTNNLGADGNITLGSPNLLKFYLAGGDKPISKLQINTTYDNVNLNLRMKNESTSVMKDINLILPENIRLLPGTKVPNMLNPGEEYNFSIEVNTMVSSSNEILFDAGYLEIITG